MTCRWIALLGIALLGSSTAAPIRVTVQIDRNSFDLLDSVAIGVDVDNTGKSPVILHFPLPSEYEIDVMRGSEIVWTSLSSTPPTVHYPVHDHPIVPGASALAIYEWNGIERDGTTSPSPGDYTVRVKLLETNAQPTATAHIRFIEPTPISAIAKMKVGDAITVGGQLDTDHRVLTDSTGSTTLPRRLLSPLANGPIVVRGYITLRADGTRFISVQRWAALPIAIPSP